MGKSEQLDAASDNGKALDESRRRFLKTSGGSALALSLTQLGGVVSSGFVGEVLAGEGGISYHGTEDLYRDIWKWDKVTWGSHTNVCVPGSCSFHVYVKDGMVWREEQAMQNPASNSAYPDYNPLGCQKGCSFHANIYSDERVTHPLKRVGPRGSGKWQRISWDEALSEVAEAIVDGIEESGPDSFLVDPCHFHAGSVAFAGVHRFNRILGGVQPDFNVMNGDIYRGILDTVGKQHIGFSADNLLDAGLIFMTCTNWSYTVPAMYHFITEARYNGTEFVNISPDYSPSAIHADYHAPVKTGGDAAFWLGMAQVMIEEDLIDRPFMKAQTDLPLLRRKDSDKFLRQRDVEGEGRGDQFYFWDLKTAGLAKAPRASLAFDGDQALEGTYRVTLADGAKVDVEPVFEAVKRQLAAEYTAEKAAGKSGVDASLIRKLGRKVGTMRVAGYTGLSSCKVYHGDLGERAMVLALALSGNWGKPGTGWGSYALPADHIPALMMMERPLHEGGLEIFDHMYRTAGDKLRAEDPEVINETINDEVAQMITTRLGVVPPAMFLYNHCGYNELYDNKEWQDPAMGKSFGEALREATDKGWWRPEHLRPAPGTEPRVMMIAAGNPLRKVRGAQIMYPKHLFPKLKKLFAIEPRMSFSALHCDIVLPAAWYYEKPDLGYHLGLNPRYAYIEQAVDPQGEAHQEWQIFADLLKTIGTVATRRGLSGYTNYFGEAQRYDELWDRFTMKGYLKTHADALKELVGLAEATGMFNKGTTLDTLKKDGKAELASFGGGLYNDWVANEYDPNKPFYSLRRHVDNNVAYSTETRRAQFYFDHDWYLETGEQLPVYKEPPKIGGDHPFTITGGHPRHSVHTMQIAQPALMRLHRAQPVIHMNDEVAAKRGIENGEKVEVFNDFADFKIMVRTSPTVAPNQVIVYMWDGHQFEEWKVYNRLLIGQPKTLHLAGGYEQQRFLMMSGSPAPAMDRSVRVDIRKIRQA
jgi:DMSO reductase family type II enzyme molybdopterin subunit